MPRAVGGRVVAALMGAGLAGGGCEYVQDRFRSCGQLHVDLVNSQQTLGPVNLVYEEEPVTAETLLVSGASRRVALCVEKGDRKRFRALRAGQVLGAANCVVTRSRWEYDFSVAKVIWAPLGFDCENW